MQLNPTTVTQYGAAEDRQWLASETGSNDAKTVELDRTTLIAVYTDNIVKSGTILGIITSTGKYGPYDDAASDGRQTAVGVSVRHHRHDVVHRNVRRALPVARRSLQIEASQAKRRRFS